MEKDMKNEQSAIIRWMPMHFSAWVAFLEANPTWHIAAPHANFYCSFFCKCILQGAIDFAERRKQSCGAKQ
jgi:hypothetical protein